MGLTEGAPLPADEELEAVLFCEDERVAVAPPGHPLLARRLTLRRLCAQPMIIREGGSGTREVITQALGRRGLALEKKNPGRNPSGWRRAIRLRCF